MPEEISAHITIGGGVPRQLVSEFCQTICLERVGLDWCNKPYDPLTEQDLLSALDADNHLHLYGDCAAWGKFPMLEPLLQEFRIPFDRHHGAKFEIIATTLFYRPEQGTHEFVTDDQEAVMCRVQPLLSVEKMLAQAHLDVKQGRSHEARYLMEQCLQRLRKHLPQISPLPAFRIF